MFEFFLRKSNSSIKGLINVKISFSLRDFLNFNRSFNVAKPYSVIIMKILSKGVGFCSKIAIKLEKTGVFRSVIRSKIANSLIKRRRSGFESQDSLGFLLIFMNFIRKLFREEGMEARNRDFREVSSRISMKFKDFKSKELYLERIVWKLIEE